MVSVSGKSRATGCGRFTSTLFWLRTRRKSSRPNSSLTTDDDIQRFRKAQREHAHHVRLHAHAHPRAAFHPLAIGIERRVDVVVEHVVVDEIVFIEEAAAALQLLLRGVRGDVALALAREHRDVFRLAARSRIGQVVEPARAHFRDEVARLRQQRPHFAAQVAQVEVERLRRALLEHLDAAAMQARVEGHRLEHRALESLLELERTDAHERRGERRFERLGAREQLQLAAFLFRRRLEHHRSVAEQHHRGHAFRRLRDEHVAGRQPQLEIHRLQHEIARRELFFRVQRQAMQSFDRSKAILRRDAPGLAADVVAAGAADVETPRRNAAARTGLDEDFDDESIAFAG